MFTIERATAADFERVYPQLRESFGDAIPKRDWEKIFVSQWESPEEFCGHILLRDGEVKGYLGLLFSRRAAGGRVGKFCNMTSWCVSEDCRGQSLSLLLPALRLKDYTFTNFTASPAVAEVLKRLGFTEFEVHQQLLLPTAALRGGARGCRCVFDPREIRGALSDEHRAIFDDHQRFDCHHLLLASGGGYCYAVLKKTWRRRLPFVKVHYLSDPGLFAAGAGRAVAACCLRLRVLGLMVDDRYLGGRRLPGAVRYPHQRRGYYKPAAGAPAADRIDTLYSELVVLHH